MAKRLDDGFRSWCFRSFPVAASRWAVRELEKEYRPQIAAAAKRKDSGTVERLGDELSFLRRELDDRLDLIRTRELLAEARLYGITSFGDDPFTYDESSPFGYRFLDQDSESKLLAAVHEAQRQESKRKQEMWEHYARIGAPLVALLVGLISSLVGLLAILLKR